MQTKPLADKVNLAGVAFFGDAIATWGGEPVMPGKPSDTRVAIIVGDKITHFDAKAYVIEALEVNGALCVRVDGRTGNKIQVYRDGKVTMLPHKGAVQQMLAVGDRLATIAGDAVLRFWSI